MIKNGSRVRVTEAELQYAGRQGKVIDDDADDPDYEFQYLVVELDDGDIVELSRAALIPDLLALAQEALPEYNWQLDEDGEPYCRPDEDGTRLNVYLDSLGVTTSSYIKEEIAGMNIRSELLSDIGGRQINVGYHDCGFVMHKQTETASDIAKFFNDAKEIWSNFSESEDL